ncbi:protein DOG1-like 4 [Populus alba x Populus x berolinensis]|uniref:Protein DOG1-like 4 n=1 Tax=Populus alba x Populus x berolinensis TaxID=444605 RepID=A0AAD6W1W2_9ROSI|nr:protein DOG1-like 4 [Populus alba x Populus x berolinensis]
MTEDDSLFDALYDEQKAIREFLLPSDQQDMRVQVSESLRSAETACEVEEERVDSTLAAKGKKLTEILQVSDDLRLRALKDVLEILTPIQAVHFLIAAAELHSRLHGWGRRRTIVICLQKACTCFLGFFNEVLGLISIEENGTKSDRKSPNHEVEFLQRPDAEVAANWIFRNTSTTSTVRITITLSQEKCHHRSTEQA